MIEVDTPMTALSPASLIKRVTLWLLCMAIIWWIFRTGWRIRT